MPLPHDSAGRDVDLLHDRLEDRPVASAADGAQVRSALRVDRHVGRSARGQLELVVVAHVAVAGSDARDLPVVAVEDHVVAHAVAVSRAALPPREDRLPSVVLDAEAGHGVMGRGRAEPHDVPPVVDDLRAVLAGAALDGEEDVAGRQPPARRDGDEHAVGVERRARVEAQHVGRGRARLGVAAARQQPRCEAAADCQQQRGRDGGHRTDARARAARGGCARASRSPICCSSASKSRGRLTRG